MLVSVCVGRKTVLKSGSGVAVTPANPSSGAGPVWRYLRRTAQRRRMYEFGRCGGISGESLKWCGAGVAVSPANRIAKANV